MLNREAPFDIVLAKDSDQQKIQQLEKLFGNQQPVLTELKLEDGGTLLHAACMGSGKDLLEWLLKKEPKLIGCKDKTGRNVYFTALENNNIPAVEFLKKDQTFKQLVSDYDNTGLTSNAYAVLSQNKNLWSQNTQWRGDPDLHINKQSIAAKIQTANNLLFRCVRKGCSDMLPLLIGTYSANINSNNPEGWQVIHIAASLGHTKILAYLIKVFKVDVNLRAKKDNITPCILAAKYGKLDALKLLIEHKGDPAYCNAMSAACAEGQTEIISYLIECKVDVNGKIQNVAPCYFAAAYGRLDALKMLVDHKADIHCITSPGYALIHLAVACAYTQIISYLLENCHVDINLKANNEFGDTPVILAVRNDKPNALKQLVEHKADVHAFNNKGSNALHLASELGNTEMISYLIETCGVDVNLKGNNEFGDTPVILAVRNDKPNALKQLVEHKADVHAFNHKGFNALHLASAKGNTEMMSYLIKTCGVDVNLKAKNYLEDVPCMFAGAYFGSLEALKLLVTCKADIHYVNKKGYSLIHIAPEKGRTQIITYLVETHHVNVNLEANNPLRQTPCMHAASYQGQLDALMLLVKYKADVNHFDSRGDSAIHCATGRDYSHIISYLIDTCGVDVNLREKNESEFPTIHIAAANGKLQALKALVEHKADLNCTDKSGTGALHQAAFCGQLDALKFLVSHKADMHRLDSKGEAAVHYAAKEGKNDCLAYLIKECRVDVNLKSGEWACTPCMYAAYHGQLNTVKLLIEEYKANLNEVSKEGLTALQIAEKKGHKDIVLYLQPLTASAKKEADKKANNQARKLRKKARKTAKKELPPGQRESVKPIESKASPKLEQPSSPSDDSSDDEASPQYAIRKRTDLPAASPSILSPLEEDNEGFQRVVSRKKKKRQKPDIPLAENGQAQPENKELAIDNLSCLSPAPANGSTATMLPILPIMMPQKVSSSPEGKPAPNGSTTTMFPILPIMMLQKASSSPEGQPAATVSQIPPLSIDRPEGQPASPLLESKNAFGSGLTLFKEPSYQKKLQAVCDTLKQKIPTLDVTACQLDESQHCLLIRLNLKQANTLGLLGFEIEEQENSKFNAKINIQELMKQHNALDDDSHEPGALGLAFS